MKRGNKNYLQDLLDSIEKIFEYTSAISFEDFKYNELIKDAVIRRFEIISHICSVLPDELKLKIDFIPWEKIINLKRELVNEEFEVDSLKVWEIIKQDLPVFKVDVKKVINELDQSIIIR